MSLFTVITILVVFSAVFGYINVRFLKMPNTIGLMSVTISFTLVLFALSYFDATLLEKEKQFISGIDFETVLLDVMLSFLLFAGALHTNFQQLKVQRKPILTFATVGTITSTFLVGVLMYYLLKFINLDIDYCLEH